MQHRAHRRPRPGDRIVVIDEVQRLPEILNEVHRLIEERGTRFSSPAERPEAPPGRSEPPRRPCAIASPPPADAARAGSLRPRAGHRPGPVALGLLLRRPRRGPRGVRRFVPRRRSSRRVRPATLPRSAGSCGWPPPATPRPSTSRRSRAMPVPRPPSTSASRSCATPSSSTRSRLQDALVARASPSLAEVLLLRRRCRVLARGAAGRSPYLLQRSAGLRDVAPSRAWCAIADSRTGPDQSLALAPRPRGGLRPGGTAPRSR